MARPKRLGLDYFPKDTDIYNDRKIRKLLNDFGTKGNTIYDYLLCLIYRDKGYWVQYNDDLKFDVADVIKNGVTDTLVNDVVFACVRYGLFDDKMFQEHKILTSNGIQKRYLLAKRGGVIADKYCINPHAAGIIAAETPVIAAETPSNGNLIPKEKESKENKSKEEESKETPPSQKNDEPVETKNEKPSPGSAAPPSNSYMWVDACIDKYFKESYYERTREQLCMSKHMDIGTLREWAEAFNRYLISIATASKDMADWAKHFGNWLNRQPNLNLNPKTLFSEHEQRNTGSTGKELNADYKRIMEAKLAGNNG